MPIFPNKKPTLTMVTLPLNVGFYLYHWLSIISLSMI
ncbi:hypothetical protein SA58113_2037 [Staphylococcus argenteus]|nr:hypothetical protein SA58113_2037 [Staphylococcus argenteus]